MATRGRHTKYGDPIIAEIIKLLQGGCIVADVCAKVGINQDTYYEWLHRHPEFSEMVDRAKADASVGAALSLRKAMMPHDVTSHTTKTVQETRLRKVRDEHGVSEQPYTYTKTEQSATVTNEFDWRAALEYLKRRDSSNWSEKLIVEISPSFADLCKEIGLTPSEAIQQFETMMRAEHDTKVLHAGDSPSDD